MITGLEQTPPQRWDGQSGLPELVDLDLRDTPAGGIGLSDIRLLAIAPLEQLLAKISSDPPSLRSPGMGDVTPSCCCWAARGSASAR